MVISERYKYLFIETPHTGSTAISAELQELYDGVPILKKHSSFYDFRAQFGPRADEFFVFAAVRNPIDEAASVFLKFANNHKGNYTNEGQYLEHGGWVTARKRRIFQLVTQEGDFANFIRQFYNLPFTSAINVNRQYCHRILRFETLEVDFFNTLESLEIAIKRPLPIQNNTANTAKRDLLISNVSNGIYMSTFGGFMREWGYSLPDGTTPKLSWRALLYYELIKAARGAYASHEGALPGWLVRWAHNVAG